MRTRPELDYEGLFEKLRLIASDLDRKFGKRDLSGNFSVKSDQSQVTQPTKIGVILVKKKNNKHGKFQKYVHREDDQVPGGAAQPSIKVCIYKTKIRWYW